MSSDRIEVGREDPHDRTRRALGRHGVERLGASRVLVVGAGAIGSEAAKNLAQLGVGRLDLVDFDSVSPTNLNRCAFFTPLQAAAGTPKSVALAEGLARFAPDVGTRPHACRIEEAPDDVWEADLVLVAVDDNAARYHVNARLLGSGRAVPLVDAAMGRTLCQVQALLPPETACLACLWSKEYHERLMSELARESCDEFFLRAVESFPALPVVSSIAGALAAAAVLPFLAGDSGGFAARPGRAIRFDLATGTAFEGEVLKNPECVEILCRRGRQSP
ncbi:MAG: ThiF family adenylyltransferase [Planctomycetes bacterium]|nr:ThiF family adenylyltransferase [Planctomycetota bacterium]